MTDPLVIDLSGNGVQLIPLAQSNAYFDLYDTGYAVHTGWVGPETGLLVEANGSGTVNNITELFGSSSTDGFTALDALDVNHGGVINASDPGFASLEVWTDTNGNGVVDPGELQTLTQLGITSVNLTTTNVNQNLGGNIVEEVATYTRSDGTTGEIAEAYFDNSQLDSHFTGSYQFNPAVLTLPNLRGYGTLPDLYIAMSIDPTLLQMVQSFAGEGLADAASFAAQTRAILYQWAGVENVAPGSRGSYMDAQELGVLEKFVGESFVSSFTDGPDPSNWHQGEVLQAAFDQLLTAIEVRLVAQGPLASLLPGVGFNYDTDSLTGSTDLSTLASAMATATPSGATAAEQYWMSVAPVIGSIGSALGLTASTYESAFQSVFDNFNLPFSVDEAIQGNVLFGGGSNDRLVAHGSGSHFFDGGSGVRYEQAAGSGDVFVFNQGDGNLEINEVEWGGSAANVLQLGSGITSNAVTVSLDTNQGIVLTIGTNGDKITLDSAATGNLNYGVEQVQFADGTVWTQSQLIAWARNIQGTTGNDTLYGTNGADVFDGKGSNAFESGNDVEIGNGGNDTFVFDQAYGKLEIREYDWSVSPENVLQLGPGVTLDQVHVSVDSHENIILTIGANGDEIQLDGEATGDVRNGVEQVQFADGTVWTQSQLIARAQNIQGTSGFDELFGTAGADLFDGKGGGDIEIGNGGNDTFVFNQGYGRLEVKEYDLASTPDNVLQLGSGITPDAVTVSVDSSQDIVLNIGAHGDQIKLDSMAGPSDRFGVQQVQFADGTVWTAGQILAWARSVQGTTGSDTLYGTAGPDVFDGKGGNDLESGDGGNDTFIFDQGYGHLEVSEHDQGASPANVLQMGAGITASAMTVTLDSYEDILLTEGTDQIKLDRMADGSGAYGVQQVQFADGTVWTANQILASLGEIQGTSGDDTLYGTGGANLFDGRGGNDVEDGYGGDDTFIFNQGYGHLEIVEAGGWWSRTGTLRLGAGITPSSVTVTNLDGTIQLNIGTNGDQVRLDYMAQGSGNFGVQQVQFADGTVWTANQILAWLSNVQGTTRDDALLGTGLPDVLDGKGGNDVAIGTGNNDTFIFNAGYGHLEINDEQQADQATNVLLLGPGISESSVTVKETSSYAMVLTDGVSGDQITLDNEVDAVRYGYGGGVQKVQFADGTVWTQDQLLQMSLAGTTGNDVLIGNYRATVFDGKGGNDSENGDGNGDTFVFNAGYGHLLIDESGSSGATNVLQLGPGISESSVSVSATSTDTEVLTDGVTGDQITLNNELDNGRYGSGWGVQKVEFADGTTWSEQQLVQMAKTTTGTPGDDVLIGGSSASVFDGKGGNDVANGGGNGDTFVFNAGYGQLAINENSTSGATNVLQLGAGISAASVRVAAQLDNSVILIDGISGDQITLENELADALYGQDNGVQQVQFADGTTWSQQQLLQMAMTTTGTTGNDTLMGGASASVFDGQGGNDYESGGGNGDTFIFNAGYGHLEINEYDSNGVANVLQLGTGIGESSIVVTEDSSQDILLTSGTDQVKLDSMDDGYGDYGVQEVQFADGTVWTASQVIALASNVQGTTGNDTLYGTSGPSTFDGKGGTDLDIGNGNNDTFIFNKGYGHLEIDETGNDYYWGATNELQLGAGIAPSSVTVALGSSGNILLTSGADQILLDGMAYSDGYNGVQQVQFADGTVWTASQIIAWAEANPILPSVTHVQGTVGNDTLSGTSGADRFDGMGGNDVEVGNGGSDTFIFNQGYGHLEINEYDPSNGIAGKVLKLGPEIDSAQVAVSLDNNQDIVLTIGTNGDQIKLDGMADNSGEYGVQQVQFADGSVWTASQIVAWARDIQGTIGNDTLTGTNGSDTFDGKGGNDIEIGNGGADTFIFNQGYGHLEINEAGYYPGVSSVLQLGAGISESSVIVTGTSTHALVLTDGVSGDQVTLDNALYGSSYGVQQVQFADGTTWSDQQLIQMATTGTASNDSLYGTPGVDVFDSKGSSVTEYGNGGNDTYVLQPGYSALTIVNGVSGSNMAAGDLSIGGVNPNDIWLQQVGNDLHVDIVGSTTEATIQNWFSNTYSQLGELTVSGGSAGNLKADTQISQLIQAMATFSNNNPGFDPTSSANPVITDPTVLAAVNAVWHQ